MAMARAVRPANSTEVDVDGAVRLTGDVHVIAVVQRYASLVCDGTLVALPSLRLGLDCRQPSLECCRGPFGFSLGPFESGPCRVHTGLFTVKPLLGSCELSLGSFERRLRSVEMASCVLDGRDVIAPFGRVFLALCLELMALVGVDSCGCAVTGGMGCRRVLERGSHSLIRPLLPVIQLVDIGTKRCFDSPIILPRSRFCRLGSSLGFVCPAHSIPGTCEVLSCSVQVVVSTLFALERQVPCRL